MQYLIGVQEHNDIIGAFLALQRLGLVQHGLVLESIVLVVKVRVASLERTGVPLIVEYL